jgi:hypothetical protein
VVEHAAEDALPELGVSGYRLADERRYGITLVSFLTYHTSSPESSGATDQV